mmetsp:Transcript_133982/g.257839  ORF Transcript_133982/g.257839 Transcript_133982/m.257839 type:complete len:210 (-) Transcript_133982:21-650(-)
MYRHKASHCVDLSTNPCSYLCLCSFLLCTHTNRHPKNRSFWIFLSRPSCPCPWMVVHMRRILCSCPFCLCPLVGAPRPPFLYPCPSYPCLWVALLPLPCPYLSLWICPCLWAQALRQLFLCLSPCLSPCPLRVAPQLPCPCPCPFLYLCLWPLPYLCSCPCPFLCPCLGHDRGRGLPCRASQGRSRSPMTRQWVAGSPCRWYPKAPLTK